jgi:phosphatidylinositol alpha-1,6-mannosyltransferase
LQNTATAPPRPTTAANAGDILLVSALFPPAIGGSAELFANVYSRLSGTRTAVLTEKPSCRGERVTPSFHVIRERRMPRQWGLLHPRGLMTHALVAADIRRMARHVTAVHCGRVLPEGLSALLAFAAGGPPYVCWVHGEELSYVDSSREFRRLAAAVFQRARFVLANCRNTADLLVARGVRARDIHVVYPGVDTYRFRPRAAGADALRQVLARAGETLLLTVGRLQRRKGHDLVLQALAALGPNRRGVRYVIVGDGEERPRIESMIRELDLADTVTLAGRVDAHELPRYYAAADAFIHANRRDGDDFEGFGMVFLEAAASGLPAIGGRSGGVPEAVVDGETGLLVSGTSVGELRDALTDIISNRERRRALGSAARARVLREFTWQRAADQISTLHQRRA